MSKTKQQRRVRQINKRNAKRPVVKVDEQGNVLAVYNSAREAARMNYISCQAVLDRCRGRVAKPFALDGSTYRFAGKDTSSVLPLASHLLLEEKA